MGLLANRAAGVFIIGALVAGCGGGSSGGNSDGTAAGTTACGQVFNPAASTFWKGSAKFCQSYDGIAYTARLTTPGGNETTVDGSLTDTSAVRVAQNTKGFSGTLPFGAFTDTEEAGTWRIAGSIGELEQYKSGSLRYDLISFSAGTMPLKYADYGIFEQLDSSAALTRLGSYSLGMQTPAASLPQSGTVRYRGKVIGGGSAAVAYYRLGTGIIESRQPSRVEFEGFFDITIDFATKRVVSAKISSNLYYDLITHETRGKLNDVEFGPASYEAASNSFMGYGNVVKKEGPLSPEHQAPDMVGAVGKFAIRVYGPSADEISGVLQIVGANGTAVVAAIAGVR